MKRQIRRGCFETNSSSTHAICIAKEGEIAIAKKVIGIKNAFSKLIQMIKKKNKNNQRTRLS